MGVLLPRSGYFNQIRNTKTRNKSKIRNLKAQDRPALVSSFGFASSFRVSDFLLAAVFAGDVHIRVDVGRAAEVPDEGGPFQPPDVPDFVRADVVLLVEGQVHLVHAAAGLQATHRFLDVLGTVGGEQVVHYFLDQLFLVGRRAASCAGRT